VIFASLDAFAAFVAIGLVVMALPHSVYDLRGAGFRGMHTRLAVVFTESGRWRTLAAVSIVAVLLCIRSHQGLWFALVVILSQISSQAVIEGIKRAFRRARPRDWLVREEYGFSYPSGHAATAVTFYCAWAILIAESPVLPAAKVAFAAFLVVWAVGVAWSRLALSAHYLTDVMGGWLFGTGWLCLMLAFIAHVKGPALLPGLR
jgi:membrane-associated phospholipid phosphatase